MKILAFETSCDDTAVAIVEDGTQVLSSVRIAQNEHNEYGGVVPEIAARLHAENWCSALEKCLAEANLKIENVDALAVTNGPGLQTALLNGTTAASFLSLLYQKPLIPVHHIFGHICSSFLERKIKDFQFPALVLVASGGHTEIHLWESETKLRKIGKTIDDAAGEAFDKVAKMCHLGYPGGPLVSEAAKNGDKEKYKFPRVLLDRDSLDFSFSGVKAAVYREINKFSPLESRGDAVGRGDINKLPNSEISHICASFQATVVEIFTKKMQRALEKYPNVKQVHFVGGVSANQAIQAGLKNLCQKYDCEFFTPIKNEYSTDNAAMIASAAYFQVQANPKVAKVQFLDAEPKLSTNLCF